MSSAQVRRRVIIVERFDPFFPWYAYPYPYAPYYMAANYGEVKIDPHHRFVYRRGLRGNDYEVQEVRPSARYP